MLQEALRQTSPLKVVKTMTERKDLQKRGNDIYMSNKLYSDIVTRAMVTDGLIYKFKINSVRVNCVRSFRHNLVKLDVLAEFDLDTKYFLNIVLEKSNEASFIDRLIRVDDEQEFNLIVDDESKLQDEIKNQILFLL